MIDDIMVYCRSGEKSMYPRNLKYTRTHEWIKVDKDIGIVGITDFAVKKLTDLVYIELPR